MSRICGVCKQPPREGQEMRPIRIYEVDLEESGAHEVGLFQACIECVDLHRIRYAARTGVEAGRLPNNAMC